MKCALLIGLSAAAVFVAPALGEMPLPVQQAFSEFDDRSELKIDYSAWTQLLHYMVLDVPQMDRVAERGRPITTGTRISTANLSRYRYEANRVVYHEMSEDYAAALHEYRRELENLPSQIDFSRLSRNEQLAYWFNLHNVAVIEQVLQAYPVTYVNRINVGNDGASLYDAKFLEVAGVPLSLNDIRLKIVFEIWDDPRVMYGFFNGAIGGPEIRRYAFTGEQVWQQLNSNAVEFINSLRGVENHDRDLRVSRLYEDARNLFPDFETDLLRHLRQYANEETMEQLSGERRLRTDVVNWNIADIINGSTRCSAMPVSTSSPNRSNLDSTPTTSNNCVGLPTNGQYLVNAVQERRIELFREGRYGQVYTVDIPTDDNTDERQETHTAIED